jgi:fermentation-respiration switch protein FrsA (DUF1100 family)
LTIEARDITMILLSSVIVAICAYLGFGLFIFLRQSKLLYYPVREIPLTPAEGGLDYEDVLFAAADGVKLKGWYVAGKSGNGSVNGRLTVLFCHGNGGNIGYYVDTINILHNMNVNCFVFDYRGYGCSEGEPTEAGTYADALAAYQWLIEQKRTEPEKIIVFGRSLGGCIAAELVNKVKAGGLWLESAFTSFDDIGSHFYPYFPVRWFTRYNYETMQYLSRVNCPVMVVHSEHDEIVPFKMGQRLYDAAPEPKRFVKIIGSHNDGFLLSNSRYTGAVGHWLESIKAVQLKEVIS